MLRACPARDTITTLANIGARRHAALCHRPTMMSGEVHYRRSRFSTRLLEDRLYTAGHSWLEREEGDLWRIGFTKFAVRMLGESVELEFEMTPG